ncbi:acyl-CoA dehydrogenase family protein [Falsihalocynthiibacter sp. SS001]|uniref:acyl-CoA dehydrogenase family protein n=1 Tax=Falsihalocynthiibacter sp. SS001 TaxID=3349698 RepID=UPI0036D23143
MIHLPKNDPETYEALADTVRGFADSEIRPIAEELDRTASFPRDLYSAMGELGLFGITVPDELGGSGMDVLAYSIVMEELARGYASVADQCGVIELIGTLLTQYGTPEQQSKYMADVLAARKIIAYCITEEEAGSDVAGLRTTASKTDDGWVLNGSKLWIHNAPVADVGFVLARTDPEACHRGMSIFIVDLHAEGVERGPKEHKLGQRASQIGALSFADVKLPEGALLGELNRGFYIMMSVLEKGRVGIASLATGIGQAGLEAALEYAQQRKQFGKALVDHQGLQWMLADIAKDVAASRALVRDAALRLDNGKPAGKACSIAKCFAGDMAVARSSDALQIFGGSGYIQGFEVERLYRDAKITQIYEGTNQIQRTIIGRELVKQGARD